MKPTSYGVYITITQKEYDEVKKKNWDNEVTLQLGDKKRRMTFEEFEKIIENSG